MNEPKTELQKAVEEFERALNTNGLPRYQCALAILDAAKQLSEREAFIKLQESLMQDKDKQLEAVTKKRDDWKASSESWESTAKLPPSSIPCGHPDACCYDKKGDGTWSVIVCRMCELKEENNTLKADYKQALEALSEISTHLDPIDCALRKSRVYGPAEDDKAYWLHEINAHNRNAKLINEALSLPSAIEAMKGDKA
jgi:hypothetical protein